MTPSASASYDFRLHPLQHPHNFVVQSESNLGDARSKSTRGDCPQICIGWTPTLSDLRTRSPRRGRALVWPGDDFQADFVVLALINPACCGRRAPPKGAQTNKDAHLMTTHFLTKRIPTRSPASESVDGSPLAPWPRRLWERRSQNPTIRLPASRPRSPTPPHPS